MQDCIFKSRRPNDADEFVQLCLCLSKGINLPRCFWWQPYVFKKLEQTQDSYENWSESVQLFRKRYFYVMTQTYQQKYRYIGGQCPLYKTINIYGNCMNLLYDYTQRKLHVTENYTIFFLLSLIYVVFSLWCLLYSGNITTVFYAQVLISVRTNITYVIINICYLFSS